MDRTAPPGYRTVDTVEKPEVWHVHERALHSIGMALVLGFT
jgi:hypothetical protein